jgi:V/A-type H+-transporting ATPase subunit I
MRWPEVPAPVRMQRVALVAPAGALRDVLVAVAAAGAVEIDHGAGAAAAGQAARRLQLAGRPAPDPALLASRPSLSWLESAGRYDLLAGEAQLEGYEAVAIRRSGAAALAGWIAADRLSEVATRVAGAGGALVPLPRPRGVEPPTSLPGQGVRRSISPLVQTYGTVPYADVDPTWLAWIAYVLMFGMMFGDAGQGILLVGAGLALWAGRPRWAGRFRRAWPFAVGAGLAATVFGLLYGEFYGPTGLVPVVWLDPLSRPVTLLLAAVAIGALLLAGAYALGTVNRWREGGWPAALYAPSGIPGAGLFLGAGLVLAGWYLHQPALLGAGVLAAVAALALALAGFLAASGGGGAGLAQALVELGDMMLRLGSNVISFTRLAAFGLTHAALGLLVWEGTRALWHRGGVFTALAAAVFLAGTAVAFSLEALVAAIQALRLEYYELFSRVFVAQGRPFRPWHLPVLTGHECGVQQKIPQLSAAEVRV